jgi:hypothetical protein
MPRHTPQLHKALQQNHPIRDTPQLHQQAEIRPQDAKPNPRRDRHQEALHMSKQEAFHELAVIQSVCGVECRESAEHRHRVVDFFSIFRETLSPLGTSYDAMVHRSCLTDYTQCPS